MAQDASGQFAGTIKSFNPKTSYGFITESQSGEDIFFGCESLPPVFQLQNSMLDLVDEEVSFELGTNPKNGKQRAINISRLGENGEDESVLCQGEIKSWMDGKGFGFITVEGIESDVYFARDRLPWSLRYVKQLKGSYVRFEIREMDDGKYQAYYMQLLEEPKSMEIDVTQSRKRMKPDGVKQEPGMEEDSAAKRMNSALPKPTSLVPRYRGTVKSFGTKSGYGFIISDVCEEDIVFFNNDCEWQALNSDALEKGNEVQFNLIESKHGKPQAIQVGRVRGQGTNGQPVVVRTKTQFPGKSSTPKNIGVNDIKSLVDKLSPQDLTNISAHVSNALLEKIG